MKVLYTFLFFIFSTSALAQRTFKTEVEKIFFNIPIDSAFGKLIAYASDNGFTYIDDKSMDSSSITYVLKLRQKEIYHIPLVSSYVHLEYSDSLFEGDSFYRNSSSISYRIKVKDYRSMKKVYDKLVYKFSVLCRSKENFKTDFRRSGTGVKYYSGSTPYPQLLISAFLNSFDGYVITVTYLRKGESAQSPCCYMPFYVNPLRIASVRKLYASYRGK